MEQYHNILNYLKIEIDKLQNDLLYSPNIEELLPQIFIMQNYCSDMDLLKEFNKLYNDLLAIYYSNFRIKNQIKNSRMPSFYYENIEY